MSNSKAGDNNKHDNTKGCDAKDTKGSDDEDISLVDTVTTKAKEVVGSVAEKAADMFVSAGKKIEEARKED